MRTSTRSRACSRRSCSIPGARICLHGGVNRNVREFYNLHADEIPAVEPSALDRDSVRRLVLVEVTEPERLGDLAELARRDDVEVIAFDHHSDAQLERGDRAGRRRRQPW